jgi:hypothetical protein
MKISSLWATTVVLDQLIAVPMNYFQTTGMSGLYLVTTLLSL